jgi:hypothetical protein
MSLKLELKGCSSFDSIPYCKKYPHKPVIIEQLDIRHSLKSITRILDYFI